MSMQLKTGMDYFMEMPIDDLNEIAESVNSLMEEVAKRGRQK